MTKFLPLMRWEDRRPGEERANSQRGCHLPESPTVPPILTISPYLGQRLTQIAVPDVRRLHRGTYSSQKSFRGNHGRLSSFLAKDPETAELGGSFEQIRPIQGDPGRTGPHLDLPRANSRRMSHQDRKKPRSRLTRQCRSGRRAVVSC